MCLAYDNISSDIYEVLVAGRDLISFGLLEVQNYILYL